MSLYLLRFIRFFFVKIATKPYFQVKFIDGRKYVYLTSKYYVKLYFDFYFNSDTKSS